MGTATLDQFVKNRQESIITEFNDDIMTEHKQVVGIFDSAIKLAQAWERKKKHGQKRQRRPGGY